MFKNPYRSSRVIIFPSLVLFSGKVCMNSGTGSSPGSQNFKQVTLYLCILICKIGMMMIRIMPTSLDNIT